MQLRPYQQAALSTLWDYLRHCDGNPALVLPTGAGKSPLMAAIAAEAVQQWGGRVGIVAHVQELVAQNSAKLRAFWPEAPMGVYAAGLNRRDRFDPILFMQIQSVANKAELFGKFDLLLIDEAHRIPLGGEGRYREFIDGCRRLNPHLRVVGLTATPYRLQGQAVPVCGKGHVLTEIAYEARIGDLIADGFLSPLISRAGELPDLSGVKLTGGEYNEAALGEAMQANDLVRRTVADLLLRSAGRRAGIVFCVTVAHAEAVLAELHAAGEHAALVHGGTSKGARDLLIGQFQAGALRWMVNVNVLSEGFDAPHIDCVAMLRPTKSPGLYYQQVGRGFRLAPGKADCLVLDYAGNMLEHGPVDAIRVRGARAKAAAKVETGKAKECPKCQALLAFGVRTCPECGHQFGSPDPAHSDRPVDAPVLTSERARVLGVFEVDGVEYGRHEKAGKTPSLRVAYRCGLRRFSEWVCVEHLGLAGQKAVKWFGARGVAACPRTVDDALAMAETLPKPVRITVDETGKYPEIIEHEFAAAEQSGAGATGEGSGTDGGDHEVLSDPHAVQRVRGVPGWLVSALESQRAA